MKRYYAENDNSRARVTCFNRDNNNNNNYDNVYDAVIMT